MENQNYKILRLTLKKKWFELIISGKKKEEYREINRYWIQRLCNEVEYEMGGSLEGVFKKFTHIKFTNGYGKNSPSFMIECKGITTGNAKPEWSDNWQGEVFIIKLGNIIK